MNKKAFTLLEILVALVVLGTVVALGLPSMQWEIRKIKNREAEDLLYAVYQGQLDHFAETGGFTSAINDLDLNIDQSKLRHFSEISAANSEVACNGPNENYLAMAKAKVADGGYNYKLMVLSDGRIICECGGTCNANACIRMGYKPF